MSGGRRPGAGRPKNIQKLEDENRQLKQLVKGQLFVALRALADVYPELMQTAIKLAQGGDRVVLLRLLALPSEVMNLSDDQRGAFDGLREKWTYERTANGRDAAPEGSGSAIDAEYQAIS